MIELDNLNISTIKLKEGINRYDYKPGLLPYLRDIPLV
jgi:hypothetical protein